MNLREAARWIGLLCVVHSSSAFVSPSTFQTSFTSSATPSSCGSLFVAEDIRQVTDDAPEVEVTPAPASMIPKANDSTFSRVRRLRDLMWVRETLEDLTAAEFAISLDSMVVPADSKQKRKRAVDYDNLLTKLNRRIMDLGCEPKGEDCQLEQIVELTPGRGMGCIAYSDQQREDLFNRIVQTRQALMDRMKNSGTDVEEDPFSISLPELNIEIPKEDESSDTLGPKLYVRDDGTVDWDGALQDQAALKNFGTAVWARINGRDPEEVKEEEAEEASSALTKSGSKEEKKERPAVTAKIEDTEAIRRERDLLCTLEEEYKDIERDHLALLNSAISAGQAVANINFAMLEPGLRRRINQSSATMEKKREEVVYQRLIYELERIYTYLAGEMGNTSSSKGYIPLQDRLNVAEFGLLESQISSFKNQIESGEIFDADVLTVVSDQVTEFKRRLGIDYYVTGLTFDREAIQKFSLELLDKTRTGVTFYVKGCKLLWNDIVFASSLIIRALQGYTLKPREVRNLRRTFKDFVTFIPVVIILIIPLSPVGHVLVFGAIQRVFPDFFPSCFREERQNLLQLYENAEYSELTINESFSEKAARFFEAFFFQIAKLAGKVFEKVRGGGSDESSSTGDQ